MTRCEHYADGGFDPLDVYYPDLAAIARCHAEWPEASPRAHVRSGRLSEHISAPRVACNDRGADRELEWSPR